VSGAAAAGAPAPVAASGRLGAILFRARSWTPIPLAVALVVLARPTPGAFAAGVAVAALGEALRLAALRHLDGTSRGSRFRATALATQGPFRFVRHPVYAGNALIVLGLCAASGVREPWFLALVAGGFALQYHAIVAGEEAFLAAAFPEGFARYRARVPRFIPRLFPRVRFFASSVAPWIGSGAAPAVAMERAPAHRDAHPVPRRAVHDVLADDFRTLHTIALLLGLIALKGLFAAAS
jgi:protein-S-isoprenylcysteine O-methyltransferase Ste14